MNKFLILLCIIAISAANFLTGLFVGYKVKPKIIYLQVYPLKHSDYHIEYRVPDDLKCIESIKATIKPIEGVVDDL